MKNHFPSDIGMETNDFGQSLRSTGPIFVPEHLSSWFHRLLRFMYTCLHDEAREVHFHLT